MIHKLFQSGLVAAALTLLASPAPGRPVDDSPSRLFLVVYARDLEEVAEEWATYRREQGWTSEAVSAVDAAGLLPPHWNDADLMRHGLQQYLRDRLGQARSQGIRGGWFAVLLLGDVDMPDGSLGVATWSHEKTSPSLRSPFEPDDYVTDHDYQLFDDRDELPDFPIGRVPARTQEEARTALEKVRRYEDAPTPGPWRRRVHYVASVGGFGAVDRIIERAFVLMVERYLPYSFDMTMTYTKPDSPYCAPPSQFGARVMERMNEGSLLFNYVGHGWWDSLDTLRWRGERYPVCDADAIEDLNIEGNRFPIMLIVACSTGRFDLRDGERSLAERLLFHPEGPIAIIAGSRITHPYPNAVYQKEVTEQLGLERRETLGGLDLAATRNMMALDEEDAKLEVMSSVVLRSEGEPVTPAELRRLHMGLYNVLGDPTLRIAYPPYEIAELRIEDGVASGAVAELDEGEVIITVESDRIKIPREAEMINVVGENDPDLEEKADINYPIANDKVILRVTGELRDGRFSIRLPETPDLLEAGDWIKAYVVSEKGDAFGAASLDPTDEKE